MCWMVGGGVGKGTRLIFTTYFRSDLAEYGKDAGKEVAKEDGKEEGQHDTGEKERRRETVHCIRLAVAKLKSPPVNT